MYHKNRPLVDFIEYFEMADNKEQRFQAIVKYAQENEQIKFWLWLMFSPEINLKRFKRTLPKGTYKALNGPGYTTAAKDAFIRKLVAALQVKDLELAVNSVLKQLELLTVKEAKFVVDAIIQKPSIKYLTKKLVQESLPGLIEDKIGVSYEI